MTKEEALKLYLDTYKASAKQAADVTQPTPNFVQHIGNRLNHAVDRFKYLFTGDKAKANAMKQQWQAKQNAIDNARKAIPATPSWATGSKAKADAIKSKQNTYRQIYAKPMNQFGK